MSIQIENLSFGYKESLILNEISLEFQRGQMYGLLGRNGTGKTTLIKSMLGLLPLKQGQIRVNDRALSAISTRELAQQIAYVPQSEDLVYGIKVIELVVMGRNPYLNLFDMPGEREYALAQGALENLGISHLAQKSYAEISGGERQLVLIARALVQDTQFIIMDEPISNLDIKNQHEVLHKIQKIAENYQIGVILSIHDPNLALRYCHQSVMLKEGKVIFAGKTQDIINQDSLHTVYQMPFEVMAGEKGLYFCGA